MKQSKPQPEAKGAEEEEVTSSAPSNFPLADPEEEMSPTLKHLLALHEQMEKEKDKVVRQVTEEKARLTEAYEAQMAKLDALLAKVAPEMVAPPAPVRPEIPFHVPQRTRARVTALTMAAGRTDATAKWSGSKFCPYCQIQGHDGRAHRGQPVARKWLKSELAAFGYMPPANQPQLPANYDQIQVQSALG